jgi:Tfp pilus assembly protein FimT
MIEILIVVAIIMAIAAVSLPAIGRFIRNYQIRGAANQVMGEIQSARNKAIMKNVNNGVVFIALSPTQYQWVIEDDQTPIGGYTTARPNPISGYQDCPLTGGGACVQSGRVQQLPTGIQFGTTCPGFTAGAKAFRYNRLGTWCNPTGSGATAPCPLGNIDVGTNVLQNNAQGTTICLTQSGTGLFRRVMVAPGGRVMQDR